mgnify:CR=1 FL=1
MDVGSIRDLLRRGEAGVVSAVLEGSPSALPRVYAYDPSREALYLHGAFGGETGRVLEQGGAPEGAPVTFTVFEMGRLLPAPEALEFGVEYESVVVNGRAFQVEGDEEAEHGLQLLMDKYAPHLQAGVDYRPIAPDEVARTSVLRIDIDSWSGKRKKEADDFPGAYWFRDVR